MKIVVLDLTPEDVVMLEEQASTFGMNLNEFVSFLCVNSVCRYRANRDKNNLKE